MTPVLEAHELHVRYGPDAAWWTRLRGHAARSAPYSVDGIDLVVERGDSIGIVGESGCGKTTLAKALIGLAPLTSGTISLNGRALAHKRDRRTMRSLQMVFQDPGSSLNPSLTVRQMLTELLDVHGLVERDKREARLAELLAMVELPQPLLEARPRRLSGGQRQRVGIARALALEPEVLIADEAVAALDVSVQAAVLNLLVDLREHLGLTLIFISHDLAVVRHISDRVLVMHQGQVVEDRPTPDIFAAPEHPYTKRLMSAAPNLAALKRTQTSL